MAAAEKRDEWWERLQKRREERMRYEVLYMLYEAADRCADVGVEVAGFLRNLGVWQDELDRVLRFLIDRQYVHLTGEIPKTVCLTVKGINYIERDSSKRRTIRD